MAKVTTRKSRTKKNGKSKGKATRNLQFSTAEKEVNVKRLL